MPETPQNINKIITSLEQLKTLYPDLTDESTIRTFPEEKYQINVDPTIQPKDSTGTYSGTPTSTIQRRAQQNVKSLSH